MLADVQPPLRPANGDELASVLEAAFVAMPDSAAILDETGTIVAVTDQWRAFAVENGGRSDGYVGLNYLSVCGCGDSREPAHLDTELRQLLEGTRDSVQIEYPCHSPTERRFFLMHANAFEHGGHRYALLRHVNITQRRIAEERALERAAYDRLTGLPTRETFEERLQQSLSRAQRHGTRVAVFFVDLDGFKQVNDTLGHAAGDALLQTVSERLQEAVRAVDSLSRAGGDEFLLLAEDAHEAGARRLAERIHEQLAAPVDAGGEHCRVGASIGVAFYPLDGAEPDDLIAEADQRMYEAKSQGAGHTVIQSAGRAGG
jgi:diguanylate cyclase (GGDEF)-like protein